jgi:hypothetical protein
MRAIRIDDADGAGGVAEGDKVFAEHAHADRRAVRLAELGGQQRGQPVAPEHIAHRRALAHPRQTFVVFS